MKKHKISIINISKDKPSTGANTKILLDGKEVHGLKEFNLKIKAGGMSKVTMTMYADVNIPEYVIGKLEKI